MKKFTTSIPVFSLQITTQKVREEFLAELKRAKADRVFLCANRYFTDEAIEKECKILRENIKFFSDNGIEAAVWVGSTIGHGVPLAHDECGVGPLPYTEVISLHGKTFYEAFCPLDEAFTDAIAKEFTEIAKCGAKTILIDDDFRLNLRGSDMQCFCPLHLAEMEKILGEKVDREMLEPYIIGGKKNKYRDAWLETEKNALLNFAKKLRAAIDLVDPTIRLAPCSTHSSWGADGYHLPELVRILAGNNPPLVRLFGAPYWAAEGTNPLPLVFELVRAQDEKMKLEGIETMCEADAYPRPRQNCPSSYLLLYDAFIRCATELSGSLNYMLDYTSSARYESGYIDRHARAIEKHEKMAKLFDGTRAVGVRAHIFADVYKDADLSAYEAPPSPRDTTKSIYPKGAGMLGRLSIPTTYEGDGICPIITGESARHIDLSILSAGAILDAVSAKILIERGVDVGIERAGLLKVRSVPFEVYGNEKIMLRDNTAYFIDAELSKNVKVLSASPDGMPTAYAYENAAGQRFLVYTFDFMSLSRTSSLCNSYARQNQLKEYIEWISRKKLPAFTAGCPDLYILCKESENSKTVALFNAFSDDVYMQEIELDQAYADIEFVGCEGKLEGNKVKVNYLPPFGYAAFKVTK